MQTRYQSRKRKDAAKIIQKKYRRNKMTHERFWYVLAKQLNDSGKDINIDPITLESVKEPVFIIQDLRHGCPMIYDKLTLLKIVNLEVNKRMQELESCSETHDDSTGMFTLCNGVVVSFDDMLKIVYNSRLVKSPFTRERFGIYDICRLPSQSIIYYTKLKRNRKFV